MRVRVSLSAPSVTHMGAFVDVHIGSFIVSLLKYIVMDEIKELNPSAIVAIADHATGAIEIIEFSNITKANNAHPTIVNMSKGVPTSSYYTGEGCKVTNALFPANPQQTIYHATKIETIKSEELD